VNLSEIRSYVRTVMDVDAEDWPDVLIDASAKEAYERIVRREMRWPFYEDRWSFTLTPSQATYDLSDIGDVRDISTVHWGSYRVGYTTEDAAFNRYGNSSSGSPSEFSTWGTTVTFWPVPGTAETVEIRGYREAAAFPVAAGETPDVPERFHSLLCDWVLSNEYQRQDDPEMMGSYRQKFEDQLAQLRKSYVGTPSPGPIVMGGGNGRTTPRILPPSAEWQ